MPAQPSASASSSASESSVMLLTFRGAAEAAAAELTAGEMEDSSQQQPLEAKIAELQELMKCTAESTQSFLSERRAALQRSADILDQLTAAQDRRQAELRAMLSMVLKARDFQQRHSMQLTPREQSSMED